MICKLCGNETHNAHYCDNCQDSMQLPGGSARMMLGCSGSIVDQVCAEGWCGRLKRRSPTLKGLVKFWRPTTCLMCYWLRLSAIAVLCGSFGQLSYPLAALFIGVAFYYGVRKKPNE